MTKLFKRIYFIVSGERRRKRAAEALAEQQRAEQEAAKIEAARRAKLAKIEQAKAKERARQEDAAARAYEKEYVQAVRSCNIGGVRRKCRTCDKPAMPGEIYCFHCMPI